MSGPRVGGVRAPLLTAAAASPDEEPVASAAARPRDAGPYNRGHRKQLVEVPLVSRNVLRRDGNGNPLRGGPGRGAIVDGCCFGRSHHAHAERDDPGVSCRLEGAAMLVKIRR